MKLTIHKGTSEIGGTCIELCSNNSKILFDAGIPLIDRNGNTFDLSLYNGNSISDLLARKLIPDFKDLYNDQSKSIKGIFISHAHPDHYGLLKYADPEIPVYLNKPAQKLIHLADMFGQVRCKINKASTLKPWQEIQIDDFKVTPHPVDHSAFNSLAFLIEYRNKKIFYTGDFRAHGRLRILFENFILNPPKNIDYLLLEGTNIGCENGSYKTEFCVELELVKLLSNKNELYFITCSSQNIDRLVSIYKACLKTNNIFVIDPYTAYILFQLKEFSNNISQFDWGDNIKVYFAPNQYSNIIQKENNLLYLFKKAKISSEEIMANRSKILLKDASITRNTFINKVNPENSKLIFSLWEGYLEETREYWSRNSIPIEHIHSSGHAYVKDLQRFVDALQPENIIPIHTLHSDKYCKYFDNNIIQLNNSQSLEL